MNVNVIKQLQDWYESNCDEDWEHAYGVNIQTLDNPGWLVKIDLHETTLDPKSFKEVKRNFNLDTNTAEEKDWLDCKIENNQFVGAGGPQKLEEIIQIFLSWANE